MFLAAACPPPDPRPEQPVEEPPAEERPAEEPPAEEPPAEEPPAEESPVEEPAVAAPTPGPANILEGVCFEAIDQHALDAPKWAEESVQSLAAWLIEPAQNDLEKVRVIFRWITYSISYDVGTFLAGVYGDQSPEAVLAGRTALCGGYARLLEKLSLAAGLEVVVIGGWAKGFGYTVGDPIEGAANHAWNAVRIHDGWYLLDSTWGAGSISEERQFVRKFREFHFLTPPDQLIYSHFPANPVWQLLEVQITKDEFVALPLVKPAFFEKKLEFASHPGGVIEVEHSVVVTILTPEDVQLSARLEQEGQLLPRELTFMQREGKHYIIEAVFPAPGEYCLIIFAGQRGEPELEFAIQYRVIVSEGLPGPIGFPLVWSGFFEKNLEFASHPGGIIEVEHSVTVTISTPQDIRLSAALEKEGERLPRTLTFVQREEEYYTVETVFPAPGDYHLIIFARRRGEEKGESVIQYRVIVSQGLPGRIGFPETYRKFHDEEVYVYNPRTHYLTGGIAQPFRLRVPGAESVVVISGGAWHHLTPLTPPGLFEGTVTIAAGDVIVAVRFPGQERHYRLLRYTGL